MQEELALTKEELAVWAWLVSKGTADALSGLSQMVGQEKEITSLELKQYPAKDITSLLGGPEKIVVGIYLVVHGDANGHLMLVYDPKMAFELVDMQMGLPPGSTQVLGEMELSVLGEMGNIASGFFLTTLADSTSLILMPSPPAVMVDMLGAIIDIALAHVMLEQDDVFVVQTTFGADSRQMNGTFVVMPTIAYMRNILEHSGARCNQQ